MSRVLERRRYAKTNKSQRLVAAFELKERDENARTFVGSLSSSHLDLGDGWRRDIVHPGAFKRWIKAFKTGNLYVPLLDSHSRWSIMDVFGHLLEAEEAKTGTTLTYPLANGRTLEVDEMFLNTKWQVIDGADGDRLLDRLRPGSVRKMSMGYEAIRSDEDTLESGERLRNLREVRVEEGSLVVFPMQPMAELDLESVKTLLLKQDPSDEEREELLKIYQNLGKILDLEASEEDEPPPADEPKEASAETVEALKKRIDGITMSRLATRIDAVRHSAANVVTI